MGTGASTGAGTSAKQGAEDGTAQEKVAKMQQLCSEMEPLVLSSQPAREVLLDMAERWNGADLNGCTLLDVQRSIFILLQGAAYRVYGQRFAMDYHKHEKDTNYPYLFCNFVAFVEIVMNIYKALRVIDEKSYAALDDLVSCVKGAEQRVRAQVASWSDEEEEKYKKEEAELEEELKQSAIALPAEAPTWSSMAPACSSVAPTWSSVEAAGPGKLESAPAWLEHKIGESKPQQAAKSVQAAAFSEGFDDVDHSGDSLLFLKRRNRIFLDDATETLGGAVLSIGFWYEEFMPRLLAACSVQCESTGEEMWGDQGEDEQTLDAWFEAQKKAGMFEQYAQALVDGWSKCEPGIKLRLKRAWRLARHYILGPQKQRERSTESGVDHRETGDLTQYIAFLDVYLQKSFVQQGVMRLTFPYFIGPAAWTFHHCVSERACEWQDTNSEGSVAICQGFKAYFEKFIGLYACPYCRHHLNEYVYTNKERHLYPVEYIFVGWRPSQENPTGELQPGQKLEYVVDGRTLKLFVWKLHNAVNSSIERGEAWYKLTDSLNASRYWPSIEALGYRSMNKSGLVEADRMLKIVAILQWATRLAVLRDDILQADAAKLESMNETVQPLLDGLDQAVLSSGLLKEVYGFHPDRIDAPPDPNFWKGDGDDWVRNANFTIA